MTRPPPRRPPTCETNARTAALVIALLLISCTPSPTPTPHYVLGEPYQAGGVWWYPRSDLRLDVRGLAEIYGDRHPPLTTDGEAFDQTAMAAANQTLPLPAIALVTNLETGRQVKLRINDRGPPSPRRMLAVTRRVAQLLSFPPSGVAQVRIEVLEADSQVAQNALPGAPKLAIATAPRGAVVSASLAPPPGAPAGSGATDAVSPTMPTQAAPTQAAPTQGAPTKAASIPAADPESATMRLPETVTQVVPDPGALWIDLGSFPAYEFANMQRAEVAQLGAAIVSEAHANAETFRVTIGPIQDVAQADHLLNEAVASGITDAHIVVR